MNYILAVFRSRYATLNFANLLREKNIPAAIINTPHDIARGCGISVKFLSDYFNEVRKIISNRHMINFDGFYSYSEKNGRQIFFKV